jgi:hypothetical protein
METEDFDPIDTPSGNPAPGVVEGTMTPSISRNTRTGHMMAPFSLSVGAGRVRADGS